MKLGSFPPGDVKHALSISETVIVSREIRPGERREALTAPLQSTSFTSIITGLKTTPV